MIRFTATALLCVVLTFAVVAAVEQVGADTTFSGPNGFKIYLSPARHHATTGSNPNFGCESHNENAWADALAWTAGAGAGYDLVVRGYSVRIGNQGYVTNKNSSNNWGADYHIPLHSNAPGSSSAWDCAAPYNLDQGASGTLLLYYPTSTGGSGLSSSLVTTVGASSPGRGQDRKVASTCCTEITQTVAKAAYLESGFHTFGPDKDWLQNHRNWGWRVGYGIDLYLGYP